MTIRYVKPKDITCIELEGALPGFTLQVSFD
jgi:hypothetical protein